MLSDKSRRGLSAARRTECEWGVLCHGCYCSLFVFVVVFFYDVVVLCVLLVVIVSFSLCFCKKNVHVIVKKKTAPSSIIMHNDPDTTYNPNSNLHPQDPN